MHHRLVEIKKQIGKFIANFSVTAEDGKEYIFDGDIIREGLEISTYDENGDVISIAGTVLTEENCADIRKQKGLYDAIRFFNVLINGSYHNADAFSTSHEHTTNQYEFIDSYAAEEMFCPISHRFIPR